MSLSKKESGFTLHFLIIAKLAGNVRSTGLPQTRRGNKVKKCVVSFDPVWCKKKRISMSPFNEFISDSGIVLQEIKRLSLSFSF